MCDHEKKPNWFETGCVSAGDKQIFSLSGHIETSDLKIAILASFVTLLSLWQIVFIQIVAILTCLMTVLSL